MKCPHCGYQEVKIEPGCNVATEDLKGLFFTSGMILGRHCRYSDESLAKLYGCPSCWKTFIERVE